MGLERSSPDAPTSLDLQAMILYLPNILTFVGSGHPNRLLSQVREIYVPTVQAIFIRALDFQVDQEIYKVDQERVDDARAQT